MKMIRLKIVSGTLLLSAFMAGGTWFYHGYYVLRDPLYFKTEPYVFWSIILILLGISSIILVRKLKPLTIFRDRDAVINDKSEQIIKAMSSVPVILIIFNILSFVITPVISTYRTAASGVLELNRLIFVMTTLYNSSIALMATLMGLSIAKSVFHPVWKELEIHKISEAPRSQNFVVKNFLMTCASIFFILTFGFTGAIGSISVSSAAVFESIQSGSELPYPLHLQEKLPFINRINLVFIGELIFPMILCFIIIIIANLLSLIEQRSRIRSLIETVGDLAEGRKDLNDRLIIYSADELGSAEDKINRFISRLDILIKNTGDNASSLHSNAHILKENSYTMGDATRLMSSSMEKVNDSVNHSQEEIGHVENSVADILSSLMKVTEEVRIQSELVNQSSAAVEEITASIDSVAQNTEQADSLSTELYSISEAGRLAAEESMSDIRNIKESVSLLQDFVLSISKISAQTNLLAMNAAIEAAHAGDSGKGFSVVAAEVRKLAENSAVSAKSIGESILRMTEKVSIAVEHMNRSRDSFEKAALNARRSSDLSKSIAQSMNEQRSGAREVLKSVKTLTDSTVKLNAIIDEQGRSSEGISQKIMSLTSSTYKIADAVNMQQSQNERVLKISGIVKDISDENENTAQKLTEDLQLFRSIKNS